MLKDCLIKKKHLEFYPKLALHVHERSQPPLCDSASITAVFWKNTFLFT